MGALEIILIISCSLFVIGVIIKSIIDKKNGKTSCGCDCANCSGCHYKEKQKREKL